MSRQPPGIPRRTPELERQGLDPDRAAIERALRRLDEAIRRHGGQRRARPYLAGQLRRLAA